MATIHNNPHRATRPPPDRRRASSLVENSWAGNMDEDSPYSWSNCRGLYFISSWLRCISQYRSHCPTPADKHPWIRFPSLHYIWNLLSALITTLGVVKGDLFWKPNWECVYFNLKWLLTTLNLWCSVCDGWYLWYLWGREKTDMFTLQCKYKEKHLDWDWATPSHLAGLALSSCSFCLCIW